MTAILLVYSEAISPPASSLYSDSDYIESVFYIKHHGGCPSGLYIFNDCLKPFPLRR